MTVSHFKKEDFQTNFWSGGTSIQLYISPAEASYSERNFELRISTAKVEVENATFTKLPGVHRQLMILEGEIFIQHRGQHSKQLKPFEVDSFEGDWTTNSIGTCTDFNVMTRGVKQSELFALHLEANCHLKLQLEEQWNTICLYLIYGEIEMEIDQINYQLESGGLLVINDVTSSNLSMYSKNNSQIAVVKVS